MRHLRGLTLGVLFIGPACDAGPAQTDSFEHLDEERGPLGKADASGSCADPDGADYCGGRSDLQCWCDSLCADYGDYAEHATCAVCAEYAEYDTCAVYAMWLCVVSAMHARLAQLE